MSARIVDFWFEFASTYSYLAAARLEDLAADRGVTARYRPFLLGPIFAAQGWTDSPFNIYRAKGRYMWRDMERLCGRYGLPLRRPSIFPQNSVLAARAALVALGEEWGPAFVRAVFAANFAADRNISDRDVLAQVIRDLGQDAEAVLAAAASDPVKQQLRANTDDATKRGIFGAPSFTVGDELFWGHDRMLDALDWAGKL